MKYLSFNSIAKRCPSGLWLDRLTGKCIPIEEWKQKYDPRNPHQPRSETPTTPKKRCPKGKWKDPKTGDCITQEQWRERYGRKKKEDSEPPKEEKEPEVPPHEEYREIKYATRCSDIPTKEAEWIFNQGSDTKVWQSKLEESSKALKSARDKLSKLGENATAEEIYAVMEDTQGLSFAVEKVAGNEGKAINGKSQYKYAGLDKLKPEVARQTVEAILKSKENFYMPREVKFGAMSSTTAMGACWSNRDGKATIRLDYDRMNLNKSYPYWESDTEMIASVKGPEVTTTPIHEMTHAYINSMVYDFIDKGFKNGMIDNTAGPYKGACVEITAGYIPQTWNNRQLFSENTCKGKEYASIGRFTQTVVSDAKKVARSLYGMDSDTFRSQMTVYGRTKDKEGIPEAVSDYLTNGENATLANKLIYFSLQRYARFIYSDDKELTPIGDYIKELRAKQKESRPRKKTKSIRKQKEYISFAQLGLVRI